MAQVLKFAFDALQPRASPGDGMSFNLLVWKWSASHDTPAKRRKLRVKYAEVVAAFVKSESHLAMAKHDFKAFERALIVAAGPEVVDGPYIMYRSACARVIDMPFSEVPVLVPTIGRLTQKLGLTSAEM
jgi:hypothetical protein